MTRSPAVGCTVPGCGRKTVARGLCNRHYRKLRMYGDVELERERPVRPVRTWGAMHKRVWSERGLAANHTCVDCGGPASHWSYIHGCADELNDTSRSVFCPHVEHYEPRCSSCHAQYDAVNRRRGEDHPKAVLTENKVRLARQMRETEGMSYPELAAFFGVSLPTIYRAVVRKTWKHVD